MKKILALLLALVLVLALCACGAEQAVESEEPAETAAETTTETTEEAAEVDEIVLDVVIAQYGPNTQDWFLGTGMNGTNFVDKFESENPGIKLNLEVISWNDLATIIDTRIPNGQQPDILNIDIFANYANEGLLEPVSQYCPEELYEDFFPNFIDQSVIDDTVWAVPDLASARALYYNVDIFEEVGIEPPTTWAELEDCCQAILDYYDGEIYPWGIDMTTDEGQAAFAYYTWNNGGGFVDADGEWAVNSAENVEAINFALSLVDNGYTNPNPDTQTRYDLQDMFAAGKLAMCIAPNSMPTYCAEKDSTVNMATASIPANEGKDTVAAGIMDRIMVFKDEEAADVEARDEAIGKFLTFFYAPENYVGWVSMEGFLPAVNSAVEALVESDPSFEAWLDLLGTCKFYSTSKDGWDSVKTGVIAAEQAALAGSDIQTELDALQAELVG